MSHPLIWSSWPPFASCTVDVQTYSPFQMVCIYVFLDICELWLYACTETVRIRIEFTNVPWTISILLALIRVLYSWCTDLHPTSTTLYICIAGHLGTIAVRVCRNCMNRYWGQKCSIHLFIPFGGNSDPVQLIYGRTPNFKWSVHMYCGIPGTMALRLYRSYLNRDFGHKYFMHRFNPFGGNSDPVQLMYGYIPISNGQYICIVGYLGTIAVRVYRNCTNFFWGHKWSTYLSNSFGGN